MFWIKCLIFVLGLKAAATQFCYSHRDFTQCSDGEICRNNQCEDALYCGGDSDPCKTTPGVICSSDFCQPDPCTSTGQCVHGHVCSQDTPRRCVYPVVYNIEEGSGVTLTFKEPGTPGSYEEIWWYKGGRSSFNRAAVIHPDISDNTTQYFNELCSGNSPCRTSDRAHLNISTGELTIFKVKLSDEGFYYYKFDIPNGIPDTGIRYEYKLNVYVCDRFMDVTQCSDGKICRNERCEDALYCGGDYDICSPAPWLFCVTDYCQPDPCTYTGQCVHGQVCSQRTIWNRRCVYPAISNLEEGSEFILHFREPATPGSYEEIQWYKGGRSSVDRAAIFHPVITDNKPQYYDDFCSGNSPCRTSDRAHLNISTGELTIHSIKLSDEDFYYYQFYIPNGIPDTGVNYEYKLNVYVLPTTLTIEGVPSEYIEVGTNLTLTCTADRIRPLALGIYWVVHWKNESEALSSTGPDVNGDYTQTSTYMHVVTKEDKSMPIRCVVVPVYGDPVEMKEFIKSGYAPFGKPKVEVSGHDHYEGEKVTLTCTNPMEDGNPSCNNYVWTRLEGNINFTPDTQMYTFIMDELYRGHYICQCSNQYGESDVSDEVGILYLGERPKDNSGLIAGCVIGAIVLIALVVLAVFVGKKYQFSLQIQSRKASSTDKVDQEMDGYENPVNINENEEPAIPPPDEYHYIDEGAMARPRDDGYMNPVITTYEDIL